MRLNNIYTKYGITLIPLSREYLDLIRFWRTSGKIDQFISTNGYLSKEEQIEWFKKVDNNENLYFIISVKNDKIGLIQANNIYGECKTGFYIYEEKYLNSIYSYKVVTLFHEILFEELKLEKIYCSILDSNKRAIKFNKSLGFKLEIENTYCLEKEVFYEKFKSYEQVIKNY